MVQAKQKQPTAGADNVVPFQDSAQSVGGALKKARMDAGLTIDQIERELHIKPAQIQAMEENRFDLLPGYVYSIGFIRNYADFLNLDSDKMVRVFKSQNLQRAPKPAIDLPRDPIDTKKPTKAVLLTSGVILLAAIGGFGAYAMHDRTQVEAVPAVPQEIKQRETADPVNFDDLPPVRSVASDRVVGDEARLGEALNSIAPTSGDVSDFENVTYVEEVSGEEGDLTVAEDSAGESVSVEDVPALMSPDGIILRVIDKSWVEVKNTSGQVLVSRVLGAGEEYFIPSREDLVLSVGNAEGVRFVVDGKTLEPLGNNGQVLRNIPLTVSYLLTTYDVDSSVSNIMPAAGDANVSDNSVSDTPD